MANRIRELLGIRYPIIQGGMAWVATGELAAAVSKAGGLGIIGAGNAPADWLRQEIQKVRQHTDQPFGVNVMLLSPYVEEVMQVIMEERVSVVTTGAGNPGQYVKKLQEHGCKVIPLVASVALAKRLERQGVDALIAEGTECGGHIGDISTMALVPQVVDAVNVPVIAAGGIADGRGVVAAFALGAQGVQLGTRFVCCDECTVHENYKAALVKARDRDAVSCGITTGHPVRVLRNQLTRQIQELEKTGASMEEIDVLGRDKLRQAVVEGNVKTGSVMAGQIAGMINDIKPAQRIIEDIMKDVHNVLSRMEGREWLK